MVPPVPPISPSHAGRRKTGRPIAQSDSASHQRGGQACNAPSSLVQSSQSHEGRRPVLVDNGRNVRSCRSESAQEQDQAVISRLHGKREGEGEEQKLPDLKSTVSICSGLTRRFRNCSEIDLAGPTAFVGTGSWLAQTAGSRWQPTAKT
jgi:hypothetical protein